LKPSPAARRSASLPGATARLLACSIVLLLHARASVAADGVVAAEHPLAAEIGGAVLAEGGSAVDAAIATSFAVCVLNPSSCGIGGGGFMLIFDPTRQQVAALDYREQAPRRLTESMFQVDGAYVPERSRRGALAVGVPGEVAGLAAAHARFGRLSWSRLVDPAVKLARDGFPVGKHLAHQIAAARATLASDAELAPVFLEADGSPHAEGSIVRWPALGATLAKIARDGAGAFYHGPVARQVEAEIDARGGVLDARDLAAYRPRWRRPLMVKYRGMRLYTMPPPSGGGLALVLALRALEGYDLAALGADTPTRWQLFTEILKFAFADRAEYAGDPAFDPPHPLPGGDEIRARIRAARTFPPEYYAPPLAPRVDAGTSHLSVIAPDGGAVACTTTINTNFGALIGVRGTGIVLNNEIDDFSFDAPNVYGLAPGRANRLAAGKRPASSMAPTIAVAGGRAIVAVGASGGPLIVSATLEVLTNVLDYRLPAEEAVAAPRIHHQWQPNVLLVEPGVRALDRQALARLGHTIKEIPDVAAVSLATALPGMPVAGAGDLRKGGEARVVHSVGTHALATPVGRRDGAEKASYADPAEGRPDRASGPREE